jgi:hypothetical protein
LSAAQQAAADIALAKAKETSDLQAEINSLQAIRAKLVKQTEKVSTLFHLAIVAAIFLIIHEVISLYTK